MKTVFSLVLVGMLLSSCGQKLKYFTDDLYSEYDWSENELRRIQFYVSQDIVLYRNKSTSGEDAAIKDGKIRVKEEESLERIVIKKGTPGVFLKEPKQNRFAITFDDNNKTFLMFGPNQKANGKFVLLAKEWGRRSGDISYGNQLYETSSQSAYAALMVDIKRAKKTKSTSQTASGKRVRK